MARASSWGLGTALAYRGLDIDAQAELLALYQAARVREGEEAELVLISATAEVVRAWAHQDKPPPPPGAPTSHRGGTPPPSAQPDILRPRLAAASLVSGS